MADIARVIIGVSGASGALIAIRIAQLLRGLNEVELHLVVSEAAKATLQHEVGPTAHQDLSTLVHYQHSNDNIGASIASGSFRVHGMIVAPCSMRTLGCIASGITDNLLTRAADVQLKERRKLVLMARETPLHSGHIRNLLTVSDLGAIVMPPVPAFYKRPRSIEEIVDHLARRCVDQLALPRERLASSWQGLEGEVDDDPSTVLDSDSGNTTVCAVP